MRILVTGSRVWVREDLVRGAIHQYLVDREADPDWTDIVIAHGACLTGADLHAARWAFDFDVRQETYPANWEMYGKRAGPFRNQQMVDAGADICLAFPLGASRGTRDCMRRAQEAGIPMKSFEDLTVNERRYASWNPATKTYEAPGKPCASFVSPPGGGYYCYMCGHQWVHHSPAAQVPVIRKVAP